MDRLSLSTLTLFSHARIDIPRLIEAPTDAIDYVITHELCHIAEAHHGPKFIALLDQVLPDWRRRKEKLERAMS